MDAQCSLDASMRHVLQFKKVGWTKTSFSTEIDHSMVLLQRRMIANAFLLLKVGGVLVYSTCSFSLNQNERVVEWLCSHVRSAL